MWVDAWQMQCCGDPFADGDVVTWTLSSAIDADYLGTVLAGDMARSVDYHEDHHDPASESVPKTTAVVTAIHSVRCWFEPSSGDPMLLVPARGSGQVRRVHRADGWDFGGGSEFVGYIVDLDDSERAGD